MEASEGHGPLWQPPRIMAAHTQPNHAVRLQSRIRGSVVQKLPNDACPLTCVRHARLASGTFTPSNASKATDSSRSGPNRRVPGFNTQGVLNQPPARGRLWASEKAGGKRGLQASDVEVQQGQL